MVNVCSEETSTTGIPGKCLAEGQTLPSEKLGGLARYRVVRTLRTSRVFGAYIPKDSSEDAAPPVPTAHDIALDILESPIRSFRLVWGRSGAGYGSPDAVAPCAEGDCGETAGS